MPKRPHVTIYSDGGCAPNPGPGGWGAILIADDGYTKELSGGELDTTNNRMELTAAIQALRALKHPSDVDFYTDSAYVKNGITSWLLAWVRNHWRTSDKKPVKNQDLWQALYEETQRHTITWHWVRGHAGNHYNERADQLVIAARERLKSP